MSVLIFDFRIGVNNIEKVVSPVVEKGLKSVLLFGVVTKLGKVHCCLKELCHENYSDKLGNYKMPVKLRET